MNTQQQQWAAAPRSSHRAEELNTLQYSPAMAGIRTRNPQIMFDLRPLGCQKDIYFRL